VRVLSTIIDRRPAYRANGLIEGNAVINQVESFVIGCCRMKVAGKWKLAVATAICEDGTPPRPPVLLISTLLSMRS